VKTRDYPPKLIQRRPGGKNGDKKVGETTFGVLQFLILMPIIIGLQKFTTE
jgi:hypothetical protein